MPTEDEIIGRLKSSGSAENETKPEIIEAITKNFLFLDKDFFFNPQHPAPLALLLQLNPRFFCVDGVAFYKRVVGLRIPFTKHYVSVLNELLSKSALQYVSELKFLADSWLCLEGLQKVNRFRDVYLCARGLAFISRLALQSTTEQDIDAINDSNEQIILQKYQAGLPKTNLDIAVVRAHAKRLRCVRGSINALSANNNGTVPAETAVQNAESLVTQQCPVAATRLISAQDDDDPILLIHKNDNPELNIKKTKPFTFAELNEVFCIVKGANNSTEHVCSRAYMSGQKKHPFILVGSGKTEQFKSLETADIIDLQRYNLDLSLVNRRLGLVGVSYSYAPKLFLEDLERSEKLLELPEVFFESPAVFQSLDPSLLQPLWPFLRRYEGGARPLPVVINRLNQLADVILSGTGIPTRFCDRQLLFVDLDPRFFTCPAMFAYLQRFTAILTPEIIQILNKYADKLFQKLTINAKIVLTIQGLPEKYFKQEECPPDVFASIPDAWLTDKVLVELLTDLADLITAEVILEGMKMHVKKPLSMPKLKDAITTFGKLTPEQLNPTWPSAARIAILVHYMTRTTAEEWQSLITAAGKHLTSSVLEAFEQDKEEQQQLIVKLYRTASLQQDITVLFQKPIYLLLRHKTKKIFEQNHPEVDLLKRAREGALTAVESFRGQLNKYKTATSDASKPSEELLAYEALRAATQNRLDDELPNPEAIVAIKSTKKEHVNNLKSNIGKSIVTFGFVQYTLEPYLAEFETQYNAITQLLDQLATDCLKNESMLRVCLLDDLFFNYLFQKPDRAQLSELLVAFPKTFLHTLFYFRPKELQTLIDAEKSPNVTVKVVTDRMSRYKNLVSSSIINLPEPVRLNLSPVLPAGSAPAAEAPKAPPAPLPAAFKPSASKGLAATSTSTAAQAPTAAVDAKAAAAPAAAGNAVAAAAPPAATEQIEGIVVQRSLTREERVEAAKAAEEKQRTIAARIRAEQSRSSAAAPKAAAVATTTPSRDQDRTDAPQQERVQSKELLYHFDESDLSVCLYSLMRAHNDRYQIENITTLKKPPVPNPERFAFLVSGSLERSLEKGEIEQGIKDNTGKICCGIFNDTYQGQSLHWVTVFAYRPRPDAKTQFIVIDPAYEDSSKKKAVAAIVSKIQTAYPDGDIVVIPDLTQQHNDADCGPCCLQNVEDLLYKGLITLQDEKMIFNRECLTLDSAKFRDQKIFCEGVACKNRQKWEGTSATYKRAPIISQDGSIAQTVKYSFHVNKHLFLYTREAQVQTGALAACFLNDSNLVYDKIYSNPTVSLNNSSAFDQFYKTFTSRFGKELAKFRANLVNLRDIYLQYKALIRDSDELVKHDEREMQSDLEAFIMRDDVAFTEEALKELLKRLINAEFGERKAKEVASASARDPRVAAKQSAKSSAPNRVQQRADRPHDPFKPTVASGPVDRPVAPIAKAKAAPAAISKAAAAAPGAAGEGQPAAAPMPADAAKPAAAAAPGAASEGQPAAAPMPVDAAKPAAAAAAPGAAGEGQPAAAPMPADAAKPAAAAAAPGAAGKGQPAAAPAAIAAPAAAMPVAKPAARGQIDFANVRQVAIEQLPVLLLALQGLSGPNVNAHRVKNLCELVTRWLEWLQEDQDEEKVQYTLVKMIEILYEHLIESKQVEKTWGGFGANKITWKWSEGYIGHAIKLPLARIAQVRNSHIVSLDNEKQMDITLNKKTETAQGYEYLRRLIFSNWQQLRNQVTNVALIKDHTEDNQVLAPQPLS